MKGQTVALLPPSLAATSPEDVGGDSILPGSTPKKHAKMYTPDDSNVGTASPTGADTIDWCDSFSLYSLFPSPFSIFLLTGFTFFWRSISADAGGETASPASDGQRDPLPGTKSRSLTLAFGEKETPPSSL